MACSTRGIFTGQKSNQDDQTLVIKKQNKKSPKGIFIDVLEKDALEHARTIKSILKSPHWAKRYGMQVHLVPKWNHKMNARSQERIAKMALSHAQVTANLMSFEAEGLAFTDSAISSADKRTPRELILNLKGLSEENSNENTFFSRRKRS